jgi:putative ABC transport system permease protein
LNIRNAAQLKDIDIIKTQILDRTEALSVASVGSFPSAQNRNISTIHLEEKTDEKGTIVQTIDVDEDFIPTMGLTVTAGRNFEEGRAADLESVLLNETAVKRLELENPIGKYLYRDDTAFRIIGVVKDWNTNSIHSRIYSTVLFFSNGSAGDLIIRLPEGNEQAVLSGIRNIFSRLLPGQIFDYAFIEDLNLRAYEKEKRLASLLISFCELTILVACLGIFGLAACSTEQRTKEIGIRKVLGSSISGIVILFTGNYTRWVIVANLFAWPVAYFFVNKWLQSFAFRTSIGPWPFLIAILITIFVALLSVILQTIKAALANPVESLRYE